ncbi:MAG: hypothetical protein IK083_10375, partial [Abditibacteriota bacterium]|nr:hypothetical protein [Abditibacteriota bacterium]
MQQKYSSRSISCEVEYEENKIKSFSSSDSNVSSYRIYDNGEARIHYQTGVVPDAEGFRLAALKQSRPWPFEPTAFRGSRDLTEEEMPDQELLEEAGALIQTLTERYPEFIFSGGVSKSVSEIRWTGENGMDLFCRDTVIYAGIGIKHVDSRDIHDGWFSLPQRTWSRQAVLDMAEAYLGSYGVPCDLPDEVIIQGDIGFSGFLAGCLNAESLGLGVSLLTDKVGKEAFSPLVTAVSDYTGREDYMNPFWDGEGFMDEGYRRTFIDRGVVLYGAADRKTAQKYGVPHTNGANHSYADLPTPGRLRLSFESSGKTVRELLSGRPAVIPIMSSGGGYNEKGDYAMPVQNALLSDGEKILGRLPSFTISGNLFDFYGGDFIGSPCDKPITQKRTPLIRV